MRKEYDLRTLKVKRRGVLVDVKQASAKTAGARKPEGDAATTNVRRSSGYAKRTPR